MPRCIRQMPFGLLNRGGWTTRMGKQGPHHAPAAAAHTTGDRALPRLPTPRDVTAAEHLLRLAEYAQGQPRAPGATA